MRHKTVSTVPHRRALDKTYLLTVGAETIIALINIVLRGHRRPIVRPSYLLPPPAPPPAPPPPRRACRRPLICAITL
jgi:hypothetical protein